MLHKAVFFCYHFCGATLDTGKQYMSNINMICAKEEEEEGKTQAPHLVGPIQRKFHREVNFHGSVFAKNSLG